MRRKAQGPTPKPAPPATLFDAYLTAHLDHARATGATARTIETRQNVIRWFIAWCSERGINRPQDITRQILERYQRHLYHHRKADGQPLTVGTQIHRIVPLKSFFKWLARDNHILYNPAADLILPKLPKRLPKHVLTPHEVDTILAQPDVTTPSGLRDRAILETLYSSGIRRMELTNLKLTDVDTERGSLMVRAGKGNKDRLVPLGGRASAWLAKYRDEVRPQFISAQSDDSLFLTGYGEAFLKRRLGDLVRRYVRAADIGKSGACHLFRHACATHMLENGADIRFIQVLLGHADISTTQVYTEVSLTKLKAVHEATHPARLQRRGGNEQAVDELDGVAADAPKAAHR